MKNKLKDIQYYISGTLLQLSLYIMPESRYKKELCILIYSLRDTINRELVIEHIKEHKRLFQENKNT